MTPGPPVAENFTVKPAPTDTKSLKTAERAPRQVKHERTARVAGIGGLRLLHGALAERAQRVSAKLAILLRSLNIQRDCR